MPIEFRCESCSKLLRTPDESAGKKAKCPQCGTIVDVPAGAGAPTDDATSAEPSQPFSSPVSSGSDPNPFGAMSSKGEAPDSENPYASPRLAASVVQAKSSVEGQLTHSKISFDEMLNSAWSITMDNLGPMLTIGAILLGINFALGMIIQVMLFMANASGVVPFIIGAQFVNIVVSIVSQTWIGIVLVLFCTRLARNRQADINVLAETGPFLARGLGLSIVMGGISLVLALVFVGAPALVAWMATRDNFSTLISAIMGMLVCIIPMMLVFMNFILSMFFVIDRREGVFASMGLSVEYMRGNKLTAFLTLLVMHAAGAVFVLCTLCIGRAIFDPFSALVMALMYLTATGQAYEKPLK
jgi:phage FluMu protein Com